MKKNKSSVILNPERSEWVSRSHVTSVESVVSDGAKTKRYSAKRDLYGDFAYAQPLKMTEKAESFLSRCCASEKQKESSLILRKAKFQAIFKFDLSFASGGAGGGKYNRISAFVSMPVLLIRRSLEFFRGTRKNRDDLSFLTPVASIIALTLLLSLTTIAESRAECQALSNNWSTTCYDTWNPGVADNCGDGCTYDYANGKLTVTATKAGAVIPKGFFSPTYYEQGVYPNVTDIKIAGEFDTIHSDAFYQTHAIITGQNDVLYVNNIKGGNIFDGNEVIGTVIVNDNQESVSAGGPWYATSLEGTVILPPTIKTIHGWFLYGLYLGENAKIYCGVENCEELFSNVDCDAIGEKYSTQCKNNLKTLLSSGKLLAYPDGCTKMGATGCTKCKNENFKLNDGECDRLRYTPAEAAKVLTDDNNNSVTITFKK